MMKKLSNICFRNAKTIKRARFVALKIENQPHFSTRNRVGPLPWSRATEGQVRDNLRPCLSAGSNEGETPYSPTLPQTPNQHTVLKAIAPIS